MQNNMVSFFNNQILVMFNQQAQHIEQLLQQHMKMQHKEMYFPVPPPAFSNPMMPPYHSPMSQAPNTSVPPPFQNHVIFPSQHTQIQPIHMDQQNIFQTEPDSIEHEMDLGANTGDQ
eukprot:4136743-Ditylum_brightwellii.AAC.1